jgi:hypothetical protein
METNRLALKVILCGLVASAVIANLEWNFSALLEEEVKKNEHQYQDQKDHSSIVVIRYEGSVGFVNWFWEKIRRNSDPILAVGTLAIAFFTLKIFSDARKNAKRELRAYVFLEKSMICAANEQGQSLQPFQMLFEGQYAVCELQFTNSGQTPAYSARIQGAMDYCDWPIKENSLTRIDFDAPGISVVNIGPHSGIVKIYKGGAALGAEQIAELKSGKKAIILHGEIRYRDAFRCNRWTKYRYYIGGEVGLKNIALAGHEKGNDADEDQRENPPS